MTFTQRLLLSWLTNAIVLWVVVALLSKVTVNHAGNLILAAAVFGILNTFLKPLARLLTLPLAIVTLGIAWFFVSILMLWLTQEIVSGFNIQGFWTYVWATIIIWFVNMVLDVAIGSFRESRRRERRTQQAV
jgi:putative membrane protein